jgi:hypothetical protein
MNAGFDVVQLIALLAIQTYKQEQAGRKGIEWAIYCLARDQRGSLYVGCSRGHEFRGRPKGGKM